MLLYSFLILTVASNGVIGGLDDDYTSEQCTACLKNNCRSISGLYTRPDLSPGYSLIAQIPKGACKISVQQLKPTHNVLALRYPNGSYILNGEWKFSNSRIVDGSGTRFVYRKQDGAYPEVVSSSGPTATPVDIMVFFRQLNPGIKYEYSIPTTSPGEAVPALVKYPTKVIGLESRRLDPSTGTLTQRDDPNPKPSLHHHRRQRVKRRFSWKITGLSACSKSCGGGIQTTVHTCIREITQTAVPDRRCFNIEKPSPTPIKCNTQECGTVIRGAWSGHWGACTGSCGRGTQHYVLQCIQESSGGAGTVILRHDNCQMPKPPASSRPCVLPPCDDVIDNELPRSIENVGEEKVYKEWTVGYWSQCSVSCGSGHRTRLVSCPNGYCRPEIRPPASEVCENDPCSAPGEPSDWLITEWSQCSTGCGTGNQTRMTVCSKDTCAAKTKPETNRACSSGKECGGRWFVGPWGPCTDSCTGSATETREVHCVIKIRGQSLITNDMTCSASKPEIQRPCRGNCPARWFYGDWGPCEGECPSGLQHRVVRCSYVNGEPSNACDEEEKPFEKRACTCSRQEDPRERFRPAQDEPSDRSCVDKIRNCYLAVQARMCQYPYYITHCCVSCRRAYPDNLE